MIKRYLILSVTIVFGFTTSVSAVSVPLSDAQLNSVLANCALAQVSLGRVQQADKPVRINRGFRYDSLLKIMVKFNTRVAENRVDAPSLLSSTSNYEKTVKQFVQTYTEYDDALSDVQKINCREAPTDFYDKLAQVRDERNQLEEHITKIDQLLDEYQESVNYVRGQIITKDQANE